MKDLSYQERPDGTTLVEGKCGFTAEPHSVVVPSAALRRWREGEHIQRAMPEVPAEDREFLISGISPAGWRRMFGGE